MHPCLFFARLQLQDLLMGPMVQRVSSIATRMIQNEVEADYDKEEVGVTQWGVRPFPAACSGLGGVQGMTCPFFHPAFHLVSNLESQSVRPWPPMRLQFLEGAQGAFKAVTDAYGRRAWQELRQMCSERVVERMQVAV